MQSTLERLSTANRSLQPGTSSIVRSIQRLSASRLATALALSCQAGHVSTANIHDSNASTSTQFSLASKSGTLVEDCMMHVGRCYQSQTSLLDATVGTSGEKRLMAAGRKAAGICEVGAINHGNLWSTTPSYLWIERQTLVTHSALLIRR